jgi:hypothetical protein
MYLGTVEARIIYTMGSSAEELEDPGLNSFGMVGKVYDGRPVRFTKSTAFKAIGVHLTALDSPVIASGLIALRLHPPIFDLLQGTFNGSVPSPSDTCCPAQCHHVRNRTWVCSLFSPTRRRTQWGDSPPTCKNHISFGVVGMERRRHPSIMQFSRKSL